MDNSDDYFQDSLVLDENDLALLAAEEAKYTQSTTQRAPDTLPPNKRQKLSHHQVSEDVLDVFLRPDGTYGVAGVVRQDDGDLPVLESLIAREQPTAVRRVQSSDSASVRPSQRLNGRPLPRNSRRLPQVSRPSQMPTVTSVPRAKPPSSENPPSEPHHEFESELAALKATVDMLKLENEKVKVALQDAETARFAKEGEVTILRKKVEKATQQHAENLNKLKEAKETANLEQARIQKEMKQQIERLRTEYIFKQHEVEASTRKFGWSTKSKRTAFGSQMSPVPVPPAMRNWASSKAFESNKTNDFQETPSRKSLHPEQQQDMIRAKTGAQLRSTASELKFPGFENSFLPSSPSNSPSRLRHTIAVKNKTSTISTPKKGKEPNVASDRTKGNVLSPVKIPALTFKPPAESAFDELQIDDTIQDFDGDVDFHDGSPRGRSKSLGVESSPTVDQGEVNSVGDLGFSDDIHRDFSAEEGTFGGVDWSEELHFILFSHSHPVSNGLTFHFLLRADIPDQEYQQMCSAILEILGTKYRFSSFANLMEAVADKLISMAVLLWRADKLAHLQALLELLGSVMTYIPSFTLAVVGPGFNDQTVSERLLHMLSDLAMKSATTKDAKCESREAYVSAVHSMLKFLEAAAWTVPEELQSCLIPLIQSDRSFLHLLDSRQPSTIVSHTINLLVVLASHPALFHSLVSFPDEGINGQPTKGVSANSFRPPLLERLSSFLVDPGPLSGPRGDENLSSILNFFHLLIIESPDTRPALLRSNALIPCLIHYLTRLSAALWEDDEQAMKSSDLAKRIVQNTRHALHLLHRLVVPDGSDDPDRSDFDFSQKLFYAPHSTFNGLTHMFIVMIGRLSYADPPDWLDAELQAEIEKLTDPARDVMDMIIEGPEGDNVWVAYQDAEDATATENDEEIEARLLDTDENA